MRPVLELATPPRERWLRTGLRAALAAALIAGLLGPAPAAAVMTFDFDSGGSGPHPNGTVLEQGHDLGAATLTHGEVAAGGHLGVTIFDTDSDGVNASRSPEDNLIVDLGNALVFQDLLYREKYEGRFLRTVQSRYGGTLTFSFGEGVTAFSIDLIDIDTSGQSAGNWEVRLIDLSGLRRTYVIPSGFGGRPDYKTIDLTRLAPQAGDNGLFTSVTQDTGFDGSDVRILELIMRGSGAVDNLVFDPTGVQAPELSRFAALMLALLGLGVARRR